VVAPVGAPPTGRAVFESLVSEGKIPIGSKFISYDKTTNTVRYLPPVPAKLRPFVDPKTGELRLNEAVAAGIRNIEDYEGWNVKQSDIDAIQRKLDAKKTLEPYKVGENRYSLVDALVSDDPKVVKAVHTLFDPKDVMLAEKWIEKNWKLQEQYLLGKYKAPWVTAIKRFYRDITPWKEEKGETVRQYIRGKLPKPIISRLQAIYSTTAVPTIVRVGAPIAAAEPTPVGEALLWAVILGTLGAAALQDKQKVAEVAGNINRAVSEFHDRYGRKPTADEIVIVDRTGKTITATEAMEMAGVKESLTELGKLGADIPVVPPKRWEPPVVKPPRLKARTELIPPRVPEAEAPLVVTRAVQSGDIDKLHGVFVNYREPVVILPGTKTPIPRRLIQDASTLAERTGLMIAAAQRAATRVATLPITRAQYEALETAIRQAHQVKL